MRSGTIARVFMLLASASAVYLGWQCDERAGELVLALAFAGWGLFYAAEASTEAFNAKKEPQ